MTRRHALARLGSDAASRWLADSVALRPDEIAGFDAPLGRMKAAIAELGAVQVARPDRSLVAAVPQAVEGRGGPLLIEHEVRTNPEGPVIGRLTAELSDAAIAAGVRQRLLDSATIILTSLLFIVELLVLYGVLIHAQSHAQQASAGRVGAGARQDRARQDRVGATQDMFAAGFALLEVMQAGSWKTPAMPARYGERLQAQRGAAR